jgi:hypothetical protein
MRVAIPEAMQGYVEAALVRLRYLHPAVAFAVRDGAIIADGGGDDPTLVRDINFTLYREKIYAETLSLRADLIRTVAGQ